MKKIFSAAFLALALMFAGMADSSAQIRYGVIGGATFSKLSNTDLLGENMTQYHAGATVQVKLPLGFSIQPSLIYNVKGSKVGLPDVPDSPPADFTVGYLELPVSVQWGPDLLVFRPFLDVTPYIGYALNNQLSGAGLSSQTNSWTGLNRFEYGLGVGIGLELWRFQVIGRYNWSFGSLADAAEDMQDGFGPYVRQAFSASNFRGITLSLAFLFGGGK